MRWIYAVDADDSNLLQENISREFATKILRIVHDYIAAKYGINLHK